MPDGAPHQPSPLTRQPVRDYAGLGTHSVLGGAQCTTLVALASLLAACVGTAVVPEELSKRVDRSITYLQIKSAPETYTGRLVLLGGMVLSAKLLKDGTRIEILQLPLDSTNEPATDLTKSQGRFLATQKEFLDPATIPSGTRITLVGEVTGAVTAQLDETEYHYPLIQILHLTVWPRLALATYGYYYPYCGGYYWGPYWGPYWGLYGSPYYGRRCVY